MHPKGFQYLDVLMITLIDLYIAVYWMDFFKN